MAPPERAGVMRALEHPYVPARAGLLDATPVAALAVLAAAWSLAALALPAPAARAIGLAAGHGALLGTALAWTAADGARERWAPLEAALLLGTATACARLLPGGVVAYLVVPAWLLWRRGGWYGSAEHGRAVLAGALFGLLLGLHLLVNASLTLGFRVRPGRAADLLAWLAYDLGANVLAAEAFFRAGLFTRAHRRWPFAAAAALSAAASVTRYLVDPLLPHTPEIVAGATFYLALLGVGNCWLLARHGSLGGPLAAGLLFFAAYRLLTR
jgi:membrane protease YdiL (CAAX protease family)